MFLQGYYGWSPCSAVSWVLWSPNLWMVCHQRTTILWSNNKILIALRWTNPKMFLDFFIAPSIFRKKNRNPFDHFRYFQSKDPRDFFRGSPWHPEVLYRFEGHQCTARELGDVSWEGIISSCYKPVVSPYAKGNTLQVIICNLCKLFRTKYQYLYIFFIRIQVPTRINTYCIEPVPCS